MTKPLHHVECGMMLPHPSFTTPLQLRGFDQQPFCKKERFSGPLTASYPSLSLPNLEAAE